MAEFMYPFMIDDMYRKTDNIAQFLQNRNLSNEYHSLLEIKRMMGVILKKNIFENKENELNFLDDVFTAFTQLIFFIFDQCETETELEKLYATENKDYILKNNSFEKRFFDYKFKFYTEIAPQNEDYENVVKNMFSAVNL